MTTTPLLFALLLSSSSAVPAAVAGERPTTVGSPSTDVTASCDCVGLAPSPPPWGANAVRLDLSAQSFSTTVTEIELSHRFGEIVGVDFALGKNDMGGGYTGFAADVMGRLYLFNEARGGVSFAAGPWLRTANAYGTMGFLTDEVAAEYRPRGGFSILLGVGTSVALNDSGTAPLSERPVVLSPMEGSLRAWGHHRERAPRARRLVLRAQSRSGSSVASRSTLPPSRASISR